MSKPHYWWYGFIRNVVGHYKGLRDETYVQASILSLAVEKALNETEKQDNGELKIKAVDMVLISQTHTYEGAGQQLYLSARTVQNWVTSFVKLVGRYAGYG